MVRTIPPPTTTPTPPRGWGDLVDRAVDEGIVSATQAARLRALAPAQAPVAEAPVAEAPVVVTGAERPGRVSAFVAEALGYVGAILVLAAAATITQQFWADLAGWAHASLVGVLAAVLLVSGAVVRGTEGTPLGRMRSVLWFLAVIAVGGTAAVVADEMLGLEEADLALATFSPATAVAAVLWWRLHRSLQQVAVVGGIVATATASLAVVDVALEDWGGLLVWSLGIAWLGLAWSRVVEPVRTATVLGAGLALVGPMMIAPASGGGGGLVLGLVTAAALVAGSVPARNTILLGLGVVGLFAYVPRTVFRFFGDQLGAPLALLASGGVLLGIAVWVARVRHDNVGR